MGKDHFVIERYGPFEAVVKSFERNVQITALTFYIVGKIVTGRASLKTMSGPIEIARYSGAAASSGLIHLMGFMALVSLQLGILNLFPIPISGRWSYRHVGRRRADWPRSQSSSEGANLPGRLYFLGAAHGSCDLQ